MFIRYNEISKWWEYDSGVAKAGDGPWIKLPIDYSQIYNPPPGFVLPSNVALKDQVNQFTWRQRISNASGDIPRITFNDLTQPVDARIWEINLLSQNFTIWALNDAESTVLVSVSIDRAGKITNGGGIYTKFCQFLAAQSAQSDPNTLDDYEEGAFTPVIFSSGGGTATYSGQEGYYTKIGNVVNFTLFLSIAVNSFGAGYAYVGGLPFLSTSHYNHVSFGGYAIGTAISWIGGNLEPNTNYFHLPASPAAGAVNNTALTIDSFPANASIRVTGTYRTPT